MTDHLRPFSGAIFDLDGTLLDSMGVWADIDKEFLGRRGFSVPPDYMEAITPLGFRGTALYTIDRFGLSDTPEGLMEEWSTMAKEKYAHEVMLKPGAEELLWELYEAGVPLAVVTASQPELFLPCLKRNGIADLFSLFLTTDGTGLTKNAPDIWKLAAEKMGLPPEKVVAFDDAAASVRGAKAAGLQTVGVYDPLSRGQDMLMEEADLYTESLCRCSGLSALCLLQK